MKKQPLQAFRGWVEVDDRGRIVKGRFGIKVYRYKKDIKAEGFDDAQIRQIHLRTI